jgi:hypothetical protein
MKSVVGVSDVEDDCGCQVVNRYDLFRVKLLLVRIKVITNILLLRFGHIPEIQEKCQEKLDVAKIIIIRKIIIGNASTQHYSK